MIASALSAKVFVQLQPQTQWILVKKIIEFISELRSRLIGPKREIALKVLTHCLVSLMKQLLCSGYVNEFKYVKDMIGGLAKDDLGLGMFLLDRIPLTLRNAIALDRSEFEEIVFEMNMVDNTFDTLDLFLYAYLCDGRMSSSMRKNSDLLEFFNLPFDCNFLLEMDRK